MKYSGVSEEGHRIADEVALGWLGNTRIVDPLWEQILHNVTEFYTMDADIHGYTNIFYDDDPAELCRKAKDAGCSKILIMKVGLFPRTLLDDFTQWYDNVYNGEVFVGHVLDKDSLYYEIHPQLMLVDVNWFCDTLTEFAQRFRGRDIDFIEPIRSEDNFHDGYTPKWVKQGTETRTYHGTCWGWNVVKAGLETDTGIGIWPMKLRETYDYSYPEVEQDYIHKKAYIQDLMHGKETFYVGNTEDFALPSKLLKGDENTHKMIICTAGGLSAVFAGFRHFGDSPNVSFRIMDRSNMALGVQKAIFENWNPYEMSYKDFILNYFKAVPWAKKLCLGIHKLDALSEFMEYNDEMKDYFNNQFKDTFKNYQQSDFYNAERYMRKIEEFITDHNSRTQEPIELYISMSNVFHYFQSAVYYDYNERFKQAKYIETKLSELLRKYDNLYILMIGPSGTAEYDGYIPFSIQGIETLRILPWYKNTQEQLDFLERQKQNTTNDDS